MNDLATMARPYCERIAKAMPKRFEFDDWKSRSWWVLRDKHVGNKCFPDTLWQFFGPLAEEFVVTAIDCTKGLHLNTIGWRRDTTLESLMAAVCDAVERQVQTTKTSGGEN